MSLLKFVEIKDAKGVVKEVYDEVEETFGMVPNALKIMSLKPEELQHKWSVIKDRLQLDKESQKLFAMVRYLVSQNNDCSYCVGFNAMQLINLFGVSQDELDKLKEDPSTAPLAPKDKALLLFALKSVKNAKDVNSTDIEGLKELGASEEEIFDIVYAASGMFIVNTLLKTFDVELDF